MTDPLRVGLLTEQSLREWQRIALARMVKQRDVDIEMVVIHQPEDRSLQETIARAIELREWTLVSGLLAVERRIRGPLPELHSTPLDEIDVLRDVEQIPCRPTVVDGWKYRFPDDVVESVRTRCDLAVLFGFGFITGPILTAPTHGVLSFHHGDLREYRGQPMGFWEYVNDEPEAGITLQRLNESLDGGELIYFKRVDIRDANRWREVKRRLLAASTDMLAEGVRRIRDPAFESERPSDLGDMYTIPSGWPVAKFVGKTVAGLASSRARTPYPERE